MTVLNRPDCHIAMVRAIFVCGSLLAEPPYCDYPFTMAAWSGICAPMAAGGKTVHPVILGRPQPRQHITVPFAGHDALAFGFAPAAALFTQRGDMLSITFRDGGSIAVQGFFSGGYVRPLRISLDDGTRMDTFEFLALYAPRIALRMPPDLAGHAGGGSTPAGLGLENLAPLAESEDSLLDFTIPPPEDTARQNLTPVYREVEFRDGEIVFGDSIYGNLLPFGAEKLLHIHLNNNEGEVLDMDGLIAKLPGMFPDSAPVRNIAVTGGASNRILLDGRRLSERKETAPLEGFGITQFDRREYRTGSGAALTLYIEIVLRIVG